MPSKRYHRDSLQYCPFQELYEEVLIKEYIGKQLFELRNSAMLTQAELSAKLKIAQSYISLLESGQSDPRLSTIYRLCVFYGIEPKRLFPAIDDLRDFAFMKGAYGIARTGKGLLLGQFDLK